MTLTITSTAFPPGSATPSLYACEGKDLSAPVAWKAMQGQILAQAVLIGTCRKR
jgi:phosphatidylethanolamine-binding protein (PEBP) family uncharacterized protein